MNLRLTQFTTVNPTVGPRKCQGKKKILQSSIAGTNTDLCIKSDKTRHL